MKTLGLPEFVQETDKDPYNIKFHTDRLNMSKYINYVFNEIEILLIYIATTGVCITIVYVIGRYYLIKSDLTHLRVKVISTIFGVFFSFFDIS